MAANRVFSDTVKLEVIKNNLKKNNGVIRCECCKTRLTSIDECNFDHIYPYAKGGKSSFENCQILCSRCNLKKNDKELKEFILEEKAKSFLSGKTIKDIGDKTNDNEKEYSAKANNYEEANKMSKEEFDIIIQRFIDKRGDIHKVDFTRQYNNLPSVWYVREYYGNLNELKKSFGIEDLSLNWTRERIKQALQDYVAIYGDVKEKDLKKKNGLPSYPCILKYYQEYPSFSLFKQEVLGIKNIYKIWTKEEVLEAGKAFVKKKGKLTEKDLKAENNLPTSKVVYKYFGSINNYQKAIDAPITLVNRFITQEDIEAALNDYFMSNERIVKSRKVFFETFPYKSSTICKRYGSFEAFCAKTGIRLLNTKKAKYTKKEVDDAVHNWVFSGKDIPKFKDLTKNGLPSMSSIMKFYENWKEPFFIYKKIYDEANRNNH